MSPDHVRLAVFLTGLVFFGVVESLAPARAWTSARSRRWLVHVGLALFNSLLIRVTTAAPLAAWAFLVRERGWGLSPQLGLSGLPELVVAVVVLDLFDYWWHRVNHVVPFFWRFHRVHHWDTHVDVSTALRFHYGELALSAGMKSLCILALGPSVWGFALFEIGISLAAQFHHSNMDLPDAVERVARPLIMTPRVHASHHTVTLRTRDANFSTIFSAWDRVFGTFREPDRVEVGRLGLDAPMDDYLRPVAILRAPLR